MFLSTMPDARDPSTFGFSLDQRGGRAVSSARLQNIDGLRAIAAMSVFVQHFIGDVSRADGAASGALYPWFYASEHSIDLGRFGVILFFLISGFVIPFSIGGPAPLTRFAISRVFRLYPAFWLAIVCLTFLYWSAGTPASLATILANLTMGPALFGQGWMSGIYWTLFIELIFYFMAAGLFCSRLLFNPAVVAIAAVGLVTSTAGPVLVRQYLGFGLPVSYIGLHLSFLFSGLLLRLGMIERLKYASGWAAYLLVYQLLAVFAVADFSLMRGDAFILVGTAPIMWAYIFAIALFIFAVLFSVPKSNALVRIGSVSYSIYLFHWIVNTSIYDFIPLTGGWGDLVTMLVCAVTTIGFSGLVFRFVEKPAIALGRSLLAWLRDRRSALPAGEPI